MIDRRGFTLIELVVVIVVIAVLATFATLGLNRYLDDGRDNRRASNVTTVAEALEKYYDANGEYPSCQAITSSATNVSSNVLKGIDQSALLVPDALPSVTNSIVCGTTLATTGTDFIQYVGDGSTDCNASGSCLSYKLRYRVEAENRIAEVTSRRTADFASSGAISNLNATANGFTGINLTWSSVANSSGYTLQRATNDTFTAGLSTSTPAVNSSNVTGLTAGVTYYFRVQAIGSGQTGNWSNVADATTLQLGTPVLSTTVNSTTQITTTWTAATNANSSTRYTIQRATNSTFTTGLVSTAGVNALSYVHSGLIVGQVYYFRVQATVTGDTSNWSNTGSSSTVPNAPINVTATVNSATQYTISWSASSGATSYIVRYGTNTNANTYSATTTGTSLAISASILQGTTHYFKVYAASGGIESAASATVNGTTPINNPAGYSTSSSNDGVALYATSNAVCPSGTTGSYDWYANGSFWVGGTQYRSVGYALGAGQSVTLHVASRCIKGSVSSGFVWSSNTVSFSRPGMGLTLSTGGEACGSICGRWVYARWTNICGTGAPRIYAKQLGYYANWVADSASHDDLLWRGSTSGVLTEYYDVNIGCTASAASIYVQSRYKCNGCS